MLPSEPGYYWVRYDPRFRCDTNLEWEVVYVRNYAGEMAIGNSKLEGWSAYQTATWIGPITPPEVS